MAMNYSNGKPMGNNMVPQYDAPAIASTVAMYAKDNASASSVITLTQDTTDIEVAANGGPAIIKWIRTTDTQASVTTTGFDFVVAKDTVRHFVVPVETQTAQGYSSVQGANRENGLYQRLAFKGTGISSVYVTEY
jgi:hypothetical protein